MCMKQMVVALRSEGIEVKIFPIIENGFALLENNIIFVNEALPEEEQKRVVLHELGHFPQKDYVQLYHNFVQRSKMEAEANEFMVTNVVKDYIEKNDLELEQLNPVKLLEWTGLDCKYQECVEQFLYAYSI